MSDKQFLHTDRLVLSTGGSGTSIYAAVTLDSGHCAVRVGRRQGPGPWSQTEVEIVFEGDALEHIREDALTLHRRGDFEHRDQFAQAGVEFQVTLGDETVSARYHVDGGLPGHYDKLDRMICRRVWDALEAIGEA